MLNSDIFSERNLELKGEGGGGTGLLRILRSNKHRKCIILPFLKRKYFKTNYIKTYYIPQHATPYFYDFILLNKNIFKRT